MTRLSETEAEGDYARFLEAAGFNVLAVDGVEWFRYNGFLRPAYLPHCTPAIAPTSARRALKQSGCLFARWDSDFGTADSGNWWYVIRKGPYSLEQCSGNTRSKIRRGAKRLLARLATIDEISEQGLTVCHQAVQRYGQLHFLPDVGNFARKLEAVSTYPGSMEFYGVFSNKRLVGFSENHIQNGAVFWESIWYDPEYLGDYSSYLLTHSMLDYYLNGQGMRYASDGSRSLYHDTNVQRFFIDTFGFKREYARLHVLYSPLMNAGIRAIFPFRRIVAWSRSRIRIDLLEKVDGLMTQESIARSYGR